MLLAGSACGSKNKSNTRDTSENKRVTETTPRCTSIPQLQQQLALDSIALQEIKDRYQDALQKDFLWCDSMLAFDNKEDVQSHFEILNLAQAYLGQFNEMLPVMNHDLAFLNIQLTHLQNDIDTHYINDSLAQVYLNDEIAVADTLHHRILYFEERLSQQDQALQSLKETLRKETLK